MSQTHFTSASYYSQLNQNVGSIVFSFVCHTEPSGNWISSIFNVDILKNSLLKYTCNLLMDYVITYKSKCYIQTINTYNQKNTYAVINTCWILLHSKHYYITNEQCKKKWSTFHIYRPTHEIWVKIKIFVLSRGSL